LRIVTRPDFDGIVCAVLLYEAENIAAPVKWTQPALVQSGQVDIRPGDILANLPFHPSCALWFDHHYTNCTDRPFKGVCEIAPSAAGVIYRYYAGKFSRDYSELVHWADLIDAAELTRDQVLTPEKYPYVLLSMTISGSDPEGEPYWNHLVDLLRRHPIGQVMEDEQVINRCRRTMTENTAYRQLLLAHTEVRKRVSITDLRSVENPPSGNRFLVYCLFPETVVNVKIRYDNQDPNLVAVSVGHSIFTPGCRVNVGLMLTEFGGGGHRGAGACRFEKHLAKRYIPRIIDILLANQPNEPGAGSSAGKRL
jgi:hypothetical protein